ncbi:MAG TPA: hypothetical protein VF469_23180, partial [Kofleriaceae bacterium]
MKCAWLWAALGAASWAGCGDPNTQGVTQLNLDRPVDISFACYGAMRQTNGRLPADPMDPIIATAQPLAACERLSPALTPLPGEMPIQPALGQEPIMGSNNGNPIVPNWYAFILQSASGTVALAKWPAKAADTIASGISDSGGDFSVLDGDPLTPGKNAISIGEDPVAIATDRTGCFEVTANAGSCDLSELDITSALDDIPPVPGKAATPVRVDRVPVTIPGNPMGEIHARPAAMVAAPGITEVGHACPATATGRVYITYPSCHLVAGVDLDADATGKPTATVVTGIKYDATGPHVLSSADLATLSCPEDCSGGMAASKPADPVGAQPVALDLLLDSRVNTTRLAIGSKSSVALVNGQASPLTIVDLDPATFGFQGAPVQIGLEDPTAVAGQPSKLGASAVALSPQIGMGGHYPDSTSEDGAPGGQAQYIYAVATDGTVRVADVLALKRECDTQIDGRFVRKFTTKSNGTNPGDVPALQCFQPRDATLPRRSGARGPGIELPGNAVPISVAIIRGRSSPPLDGAASPSPLLPSPTILLGTFAIVTSSTGASYVVNVDDDYAPDVFDPNDPLNTAPALVMAHQLRDNVSNRGQGPETSDGAALCKAADPLPTHGGGFGGGPRLVSPTQANPPPGTIVSGKVLPLPTIQQVACELDFNKDPKNNQKVAVSELDFAAPVTSPNDTPDQPSRDYVYPDLRSVTNENWTLIWEGTLSLDNITIAVDGPVIRSGQVTVDSHGMTLADPAQPFCEMGVEPFDIVDLRGCNPANGDGDCPADYTCYVHPRSQGIGVGACMLKSEAPRLADACFEFLTTRRRYTVDHANTGQLILLERWHELANTPIDGCVDDNQCNQLAQDAPKIDPSLQTTDPFDPQTSHWSCRPDPLRAPINPDPARNKRCVQTCSTDPKQPVNCASGTICRPLGDPKAPNQGICMEGVEPPQECVRGPQRFDVRASEAFTVIGLHTGYVHTITRDSKDPSGLACTRPAPNPTAQTLKVGRIPINPTKVPACAPPGTTNPVTGELKAQPGVFEPNPCSLTTVQQFDIIQPIATPACTAALQLRPPPAGVTNGQPVPALRDAQAIRFRNQSMTLTLVDPYQSCIPNKQPDMPPGSPPVVPYGTTPALIPLANRGYQIDFTLKAGYTPVQLPLLQPSTYPVKV